MAGKLAEALVRAGVLAADAYDIEEELGLRKDNSVNLTATISDGIGFSVGVPIISRIPGFSPSILASFVAGTTATQSGTTVTVTATAHGIVGSAARNGWRIYWPGSPSIAAGWYQGFAWVDGNTITFTNPTSQTVASEPMNGEQPSSRRSRCRH